VDPKVTFVVPCYNLANLLPECINSILAQTFEDYEVLIMDDCSPDATPEVAQSFRDPRVKHVRNESNLKHLANYNKGIGMAKGKYVWLISADDCLSKPNVLERYVAMMDDHPDVGYIFCPAKALQDGEETDVVPWSFHGESDRIFKGHEFFVRLLSSNCIASPCAMVRSDCYKIAQFPLDLPYAGDWYLWCFFALRNDVAYLAEPMVNYRLHEKSCTNHYLSEDKDVISIDEINVRWKVMKNAEEAGCKLMADKCLDYIINDYVTRIHMKDSQNHRQGITFEGFEQSLSRQIDNPKKEKYIRAKVLYGMANNYYLDQNFSKANMYYLKTIRERPVMLKAYMKYALTAVSR